MGGCFLANTLNTFSTTWVILHQKYLHFLYKKNQQAVTGFFLSDLSRLVPIERSRETEGDDAMLYRKILMFLMNEWHIVFAQ